jgi:hypothetical protein
MFLAMLAIDPLVFPLNTGILIMIL